MTKAQPIKVLIVDDHLMVRKGLAMLVSGFSDLQLAGEAANAAEALALFESQRPDVTLMDMVLPDLPGAEAIRQIRQRHPQAVCIALSSFGDEKLIQDALQAGARGFLYKDVGVEELANAIRQTHKGQMVLDPKATNTILRLIDTPAVRPTESENPELSPRERQVLALITRGLTNKQIALQMAIQPSTVKQYVNNIFAKLKVKSRAEATAAALRQGLVE